MNGEGPSGERLNKAIAELTALRAFPREDVARGVIASILYETCIDDGHVTKVVRRMLELDSWPGPGTLRRTAQDLKPRRYEPTEYERQKAQWEAEKSAGLARGDCYNQSCWGGYVRRGGEYVRCECQWGQKLTDAQLENANQLEQEQRARPQPERKPGTGLQPAAAELGPSQLDALPQLGEQRDRLRERERMHLIRANRRALLDAAESGGVQ